jgi:hypothetical protein
MFTIITEVIIIIIIIIIIQLNSYLFTRELNSPEASYKASTLNKEEIRIEHLEA